MTMLTMENTVGEFVVEAPARSRVFERLGIDYCCGGKKPLAEACRRKGIDPVDVLKALEGLDPQPAADPSAMTLTELADHIEQTHHAWLREELPRIAGLIEKVARVHGESYPWTKELQSVFSELHAEMIGHMGKEEGIFFPAIRQLESGHPLAPGIAIHLDGPVHCLEAEHESAGRALEAMRRLSSDFTPPQGACNTFRAMLGGLAEFEADMHRHVHKENNILFPRGAELARRKAVATGA